MSPRQQLAGFLAKYSPEIERLGKAVLRKMNARLPGATQLVYDNYNALAIGFGPSERASECLFSIALFPRWISLFFFEGRQLPDPEGLLKGKGSQVRHLVLQTADDLDRPAVRALMAHALKIADPPMPTSGRARIVIKSVSAKQRSRRPVPSATKTSSRRVATRRA